MNIEISTMDFEMAKAEYEMIRRNDLRLYILQSKFSNYIFREIGYFPINNGSFGLWLNHDASDLDLAIGVSDEETGKIISKLKKISKFKGIRKSTDDSYRYIFHFFSDGVEIDLGVLPLRDYQLTLYGMNACRELMTEEERIIHVWNKNKLLEEGNIKEYSKYKLKPYEKYFDKIFNFTPVL